jgi:hypothetical protein
MRCLRLERVRTLAEPEGQRLDGHLAPRGGRVTFTNARDEAVSSRPFLAGRQVSSRAWLRDRLARAWA